MKKTLLSVLLVALGTLAYAGDVYFFSPTGAGEADGSSWENAAAGDDLGAFIAAAEPGTICYLQEGNYLPDANTNRWTVAPGVILKGGYPTTMTGTDTEYDYTKGGQSVFSADLDGDGKGDNTNYAFVYIGEGDPTEKSNAYYKDWAAINEFWGITFRDGYRKESKYWGNMVFIQAAQVDFHFCKFLNNNSWRTTKDANGSNGAVEIWGSSVRCFDCIFRDNITAAGSGAAFQCRARQSNSSATDPADYAIAYFERCEFDNNIAYCTGSSTETDKNWGTYGGNCSIADNSGTIYMINCTVGHAKAWYRGVGIRVSTNDKAYFINTTFMDNPCVNRGSRGSNNGSAVSAGDNSTCYFANNIMVEKAQYDDYTSSDAVVFIQNASAKAYSAGYNVFGTVMDNGGNLASWPATDNYPSSLATVNTVEKVFGTNDFESKGGFSRIIAPVQDVKGMTVADLKAAVAQWPVDEMAKVMDLEKDQRGYTRAATTMSGAYDAEATAPVETGLENLKMENIKASKVVVDGQLYIIRNGVYYNALGAQM